MSECVCNETSSRNCPVHNSEKKYFMARIAELEQDNADRQKHYDDTVEKLSRMEAALRELYSAITSGFGKTYVSACNAAGKTTFNKAIQKAREALG